MCLSMGAEDASLGVMKADGGPLSEFCCPSRALDLAENDFPRLGSLVALLGTGLSSVAMLLRFSIGSSTGECGNEFETAAK